MVNRRRAADALAVDGAAAADHGGELAVLGGSGVGNRGAAALTVGSRRRRRRRRRQRRRNRRRDPRRRRRGPPRRRRGRARVELPGGARRVPNEPFAGQSEAGHPGGPGPGEEGGRGSRCKTGSSAAVVDARISGVVAASKRVPRAPASVRASLDPRPQSREERSDGHCLERERGAHLLRRGERLEGGREKRKKREAIESALDFRSSPTRPLAALENPQEIRSSSRERWGTAV